MNILVWVIQIFLALHTAIGAMWKFSNSEQTMPSLSAIPHSIWLGMSIIELFCCLGLMIPAFNKSLAYLAPLAAICIAMEMLVFCSVHIASGDQSTGPLIYWLVVAAVCAFIACFRLARKTK